MAGVRGSGHGDRDARDADTEGQGLPDSEEGGGSMREFTDEQVERAASDMHATVETMRKWDEIPLTDRATYQKMARAAAPFLQLPLEEPNDAELHAAASAIKNYADTPCPYMRQAESILQIFIRGRNAALLLKPVDPRRENLHKLVMRYKTTGQPAHPERMVDEILAALDEVKP